MSKYILSPCSIVLFYYPTAKPIKVKNHYEIQDENGIVLGKGKNKRCAWISASRNINN